MLFVRKHLGACIMVAMGVRVRDRVDGANAQIFFHQIFRRLGALHAGRDIHHKPAVVSLDEGDIGDRVAANLVYSIGDFVQAVVEVQLSLLPQRRVHAALIFIGLKKAVQFLKILKHHIRIFQRADLAVATVDQTVGRKLLFARQTGKVVVITEVPVVLDRMASRRLGFENTHIVPFFLCLSEKYFLDHFLRKNLQFAHLSPATGICRCDCSVFRLIVKSTL